MKMHGNIQTFVKISRARHSGGEGERWGRETVSPTLNVFDNGDTRSVTLVSRKIRKRKSYGINPQASLMYPCSEELGQTLTVCHGAAVVVKGKKTGV